MAKAEPMTDFLFDEKLGPYVEAVTNAKRKKKVPRPSGKSIKS